MHSSPTSVPVLYSFRRCPYAIRARMALDVADVQLEHREVLLRDKPAAMLEASAKGTVPILVLPDGTVLEESLDVMRWALRVADPEGWLDEEASSIDLLEAVEQDFKPQLDGYKYGHRGTSEQEERCRDAGVVFLRRLEERLEQGHLLGPRRSLADVGTFPFVRQFAHHDRAFFTSLGIPRLEQWLDAFLSSERFARIMQKRAPWQPSETADCRQLVVQLPPG